MRNMIRGASLALCAFSLSLSCMSLLYPGYNELIAAVNKGDTASVRNLIKNGANVNARGGDGLTVLMNAVCCAKTNVEIVILLLDNGAEVNARTADGGLTPLMFAVQNGYPEFISLLLSRGAAVNAQTSNGSTALSLAEQFGKDEIAEILKRAGGVGIKTGDLPLGPLGSLPQKHREAVLAVNRAWVTGKLTAPAADFLKVVAESKPDLDPPLSLGDIGGDALQAVLDGKATTIAEFLEAWAEYIAMNAAADKLSSERYLSSKEGLERAERMRRSRVAFRAALERAVALDKTTRLKADSILLQAGLPLGQPSAITSSEPKSSKDYVLRGDDYLKQGQYDRAIADFSTAITLDPTSSHPYTFRGQAYLRQGLYDQAVADLTKAIALDPSWGDAFGYRGQAYLRKGRYDQAIADLNDAIARDPKWAEAYGLRGEAYLRKGRYDSAIADYTKALALNPKLSEAYYQRGYAYGMEGQYEKAVPDAEKAAALNPAYADAYLLKAIACERLKRTQDAIKAYGDFIKHAPPDDASRIENAKRRINELEKQ
jgi:tetratricopeptide (TPR) repeat protein